MEAITSSYYAAATWTAMAFAFFSQASGVQSLNLYSNQILAEIFASHQLQNLNPTRATNGIGLFQLAGAAMAPFLTKVPTKVIIIGGQFCVAILIALVGVFNSLDMMFWLLICMYAQLFIYQLTIGNMYWIYVGQIACEKGIALSSGVYWGCYLAASFVTQLLANNLGPSGMFYLFGGLSALGFVVFFFCIKETQGLLKEDIE